MLQLLKDVLASQTSYQPFLNNCAYTQVTAVEEVGSLQERYDPSFGVGVEWKLQQVNGQKPSDQQLDEYEPTPHKRHPAVLNFDFIDFESVQLLDKFETKSVFSFKVLPHSSSRLEERVTHQLTIDTDTELLVEMRSSALESFRMFPWMRVLEYTSSSSFRFEEQTNNVVLEQFKFKLKVQSGKDTVQHEYTKNFSDFDCSSVSAGDQHLDSEPDKSKDEMDDYGPQIETLNQIDSTNW